MKSAELTESCPLANWCLAIFLISNMLLCPGRELNVHTWKETWIDDWYHLDIFELDVLLPQYFTGYMDTVDNELGFPSFLSV